MAEQVATNRTAQALSAVLSKLEPERRASTAAWLALMLADSLPRDEKFPPFLSVFTSLFISEVLGQDPHGSPALIRAALAEFAIQHPPDAAAAGVLLTLMKESLDGGDVAVFAAGAREIIGAEFHLPTAPAADKSIDSSPLGVRFGFKSKTSAKRGADKS